MKSRTKKKFHFNFGLFLIIVAAAVNVSRWVGAFTFGRFIFLDALSGLSMGLAMAAAIAFTFHRLGRMQAFTSGGKSGKSKPIMRFWLSLGVGIIILALSVYLLPPYVISTMPKEFKVTLASPDLWAALSVLAADLLVVMVSLVDTRAAGFTVASGREGGPTRQPRQVTSGKVVSGKGGKVAGGKPGKRQVTTPARKVAGLKVTDPELLNYLLQIKQTTGSLPSKRATGKHFNVSHQALSPRIDQMVHDTKELQ